MTPSRPLTHDLFLSFAQAFHLQLIEVLIYNLIDGVFYAKIICSNGEKVEEIDARTSDAVALAVRFEVPIFTYDFIMSSAGIVIEGNEFAFLENLERANRGEDISAPKEDSPSPSTLKETTNPLANLSLEQLEKALNTALSEENYETAATLRDEIERRK